MALSEACTKAVMNTFRAEFGRNLSIERDWREWQKRLQQCGLEDDTASSVFRGFADSRRDSDRYPQLNDLCRYVSSTGWQREGGEARHIAPELMRWVTHDREHGIPESAEYEGAPLLIASPDVGTHLERMRKGLARLGRAWRVTPKRVARATLDIPDDLPRLAEAAAREFREVIEDVPDGEVPF